MPSRSTTGTLSILVFSHVIDFYELAYEAAKKLMDDKLNSLFGGVFVRSRCVMSISQEYPTLFLRLIVLVEDGVNGVDKNTLKGMKKPLAMALTKLKQNVCFFWRFDADCDNLVEEERS